MADIKVETMHVGMIGLIMLQMTMKNLIIHHMTPIRGLGIVVVGQPMLNLTLKKSPPCMMKLCPLDTVTRGEHIGSTNINT